MFIQAELLTTENQFVGEDKLKDLASKLDLRRTSRPTLTKNQIDQHKIKLSALEANDLGKKVLDEWQIEVLYGYSSSMREKTEAIKLTNKISGESMAFLKSDLQDTQKTNYIVKKLSIIGEVERSNVRFFLNYLNAARGIPEMITEVEDLTLVVSESNLKVGRSMLEYYTYFLDDFTKNFNKYPTKSSNQYKKNISHGVIIDTDNNEYPKNEHGYHPVAIRTGVLKRLFPYMDNREYGQIIHRLAHLGVFHKSITTRIFEGKESFKPKFKMKEEVLEKKNDKNYTESVYIFNIIPSLLDGN